jgi:F420-non-reducing hydrogenase small subunit
MAKVRVSEEWFTICGGCELATLDIGEPLVGLLDKIEFVHIPVLMDYKYFGQTGDRDEISLPEADVGIITGGIRDEEQKHLAKIMRDKCGTIIAMGACATQGGIPSLNNMYDMNDMRETVFRHMKSTEPNGIPGEQIPAPLERVYAVDEVIKVDLKIPGCPPASWHIVEALSALLEGKTWKLPEKSECEYCPRERKMKADISLKRNLEPIPDTQRCMLETGYLCLGPVTLGGCGGAIKTPRCIAGNMPCEGCFGPIRDGANPMVDMMGALSSIGLDPKTILDRRATFNRFIGAHNRLRKLPGTSGR